MIFSFFFCGDNSIFNEFGSIFFYICITVLHIMLCFRPKNHHCLCHTCTACFESISKHLRNIFLYLKFCWSLQFGIYHTKKEGEKKLTFIPCFVSLWLCIVISIYLWRSSYQWIYVCKLSMDLCL